MPRSHAKTVSAGAAAVLLAMAVAVGLEVSGHNSAHRPVPVVVPAPTGPAGVLSLDGLRISVLTRSIEQLRAGAIRLRVRALRSGSVVVAGGLAEGAAGAGTITTTAPRRVALRRGGTQQLSLPLTPTGALLAASCTPLAIVVTGSRSPDRRSEAALAVLLADPSACGRASPLPATTSVMHTGTGTRPPVDPREQTAVAFGDRSHWLQPWRAYVDTPPATKLLDAVGMNFNVSPPQMAATARLLAASGVRRVRVEVPWSSMSFAHPYQLQDPAAVQAEFTLLRRFGLRPLVLLNANSMAPGPVSELTLNLAAAAPAGARTVRLSQASVKLVVPGKTGLNQIGAPRSPDVLLTGVDTRGQATLAEPLPRALPAGPYPATTVRYGPFSPPFLASGAANPQFAATLQGWLAYVGAVTHAVRDAIGSEDFDVEIWNELSFGSDFLSAASYENPAPAGRGDVVEALLARTVAWLRDPRNAVSRIGIGDGFANQTPFVSGATVPPGLTAIDKHPYSGPKQFPAAESVNNQQPLNALGQADASFTPSYTELFPEYYLTAIQTESLVRDISPITSSVNGIPHGRLVHPPASTAPTMWITEFNQDPSGVYPTLPGALGAAPAGRLTAADIAHLEAKAVLRTLVSYVNKGVSAVDFYAAEGPTLGLVSQRFFSDLAQRPGSYPPSSDAGDTMAALSRLTGALGGATPVTHPERLTLTSVSSPSDHAQFTGDGSSAHPPLYDRDVLGFFPFQLTNAMWAVPVYVMTRNVATLYRPDLAVGDEPRYDLPDEPFRLTIAGVGGPGTRVSLYDPLSGRFAPVHVVATTTGHLIVDVDATDSPRLLFIERR